MPFLMTSTNTSSTHPKLVPKLTLFVCQSCHSSKNRPEHQPTDGAGLLAHLNTQWAESLSPNDLVNQPVDCLWTCNQSCAVAFSAPDKPTYLFTHLPTDGTATALLQFGKLYLDSKTGDIPWKQFPEALQAASIAKIPAIAP
jgi:predicted metal-binding protein